MNEAVSVHCKAISLTWLMRNTFLEEVAQELTAEWWSRSYPGTRGRKAVHQREQNVLKGLKCGSAFEESSGDLTEAEDIKKRWQEYTENYTKKIFKTQTIRCDHSPRARHPGMWSQVGLSTYHYEQSLWRWWNSSWAILNPKWCCESATLNMSANLENSAVATGLEKVNFHSSQRKAMPKNAQTTTQFHSSNTQ